MTATYAPAFCVDCGAPATRPGGDAGTGPYSIKHQPICPSDPTAGVPAATWTPETITAFETDTYQCWGCNAVHLVKTGCPRAPRTRRGRAAHRAACVDDEGGLVCVCPPDGAS